MTLAMPDHEANKTPERPEAAEAAVSPAPEAPSGSDAAREARPSGPVVVRASTADDDEARDAFVKSVSGGTFFHLAGWRRTVERVMRHRGRDLIASQGEEIVGVLPLVECRGLRGGRSLISVPYAVYGGPVGTTSKWSAPMISSGETAGVLRW